MYLTRRKILFNYYFENSSNFIWKNYYGKSADKQIDEI